MCKLSPHVFFKFLLAFFFLYERIVWILNAVKIIDQLTAVTAPRCLVCYAVALEFQLPAITRKHFRFFLRPLAAILLPLLDGSRLMPAHSVALWEYYLKMNRPRSESSFEISDKISKSTSSSFAITPMLALSPLRKEFEFELSHIPLYCSVLQLVWNTYTCTSFCVPISQEHRERFCLTNKCIILYCSWVWNAYTSFCVTTSQEQCRRSCGTNKCIILYHNCLVCICTFLCFY